MLVSSCCEVWERELANPLMDAATLPALSSTDCCAVASFGVTLQLDFRRALGTAAVESAAVAAISTVAARTNFEGAVGSIKAPGLKTSGFCRLKSSGGFRNITAIASSTMINPGIPEEQMIANT